MPKDEFDFDDPLELNGRAFLTEEDTTGPMSDCFIEEFMRMGYSPTRILALFRNPHYLGMHMVYARRGEAFVRETISQVFARWGRPFTWPSAPPLSLSPAAESPTEKQQENPIENQP